MKTAYPVAAPEVTTDRVLAWRGPLDESLPVLANLGYDGVELMVRAPEELDADAVLQSAAHAGLSIAAVGTGPIALERGLSLSAADEVVRAAAVRAGEAAIRLAGRLDADLTIGAFRGRCEPQDVPAAIERFTESIRLLLPVARQCNVRMCFEPQNRFQSSFFRTVAQSLMWLAELDDPQVGLSLDTFHMSIEESSLADALQSARERLFYVQLADNHRGPVGTGMFPWERFVLALEAVGYDSWMCMEVVPPRDHTDAAESSLNGFRRIFGAGHR